MAKQAQVYEITIMRRGRERVVSGTIAEHLKYFGYTLETGKSWEHEKGNKKINMNPKTIEKLVEMLNRAEDNAARNGYGGTHYRI